MTQNDILNLKIGIPTIVILFLLLFFMNIPVKHVKNAKLAQHIQEVLDKSDIAGYTVGEPVIVTSTLQTMVQAYRLHTQSESDDNYAFILRIMGIGGPVPAVFMYTENAGAEFINFTGFYDTLKDEHVGITDTQLAYWAKRITETCENQNFREEDR